MKSGCRSFIISVTKLFSFKRQFCVHLYRANKRTILNTYKTFKLSFRHVSAHYVPSSGSVFSQVLKTKTNGIVTKTVPSDVLDVSYAYNTMHFGVIKTMYCKINGVNQFKKIIFCSLCRTFCFYTTVVWGYKVSFEIFQNPPAMTRRTGQCFIHYKQQNFAKYAMSYLVWNLVIVFHVHRT